MPRFALLTHDHPFLHWDLLLETGETCRTWRLLSPPDTPGQIAAEALADHRPFYLDYEGPVSGGRGTVAVWDRGEFVWVTAREGEEICVLLRGGRAAGRWTLRHDAATGRWTAERTATASL